MFDPLFWEEKSWIKHVSRVMNEASLGYTYCDEQG